MKNYTTPVISDYGDLASITAVAGAISNGDVLVDINGGIIITGNQSIDACPTQNGEECIIAP